MKIHPFFGVLGLAVSVACGGSDDDGGGGNPTVSDTIVPGTEVADTIVPGTESYLYKGSGNSGANKVLDNPAYEIASGVNPLHKSNVAQDDGLWSYEYILHGTDAELDAWLAPTDVLLERSPAGGLTYARVLTTDVRRVPATLQP